jgi:hypothetical protein
MTRAHYSKALVLLGALVALWVAPASAWTYLGFEQLTVAGTAGGFTAATIDAVGGHPQATRAVCRLETAQIRYRYDGTAATATVGTLLEIGDVLTLDGYDALKVFSAIRTGGTSGVLDCSVSAP